MKNTTIKDLLRPVSEEQLKQLSRQELIAMVLGEQNLRIQMEDQLDEARALHAELKEKVLEVEGKLVRIRSKLFLPKTEKRPNLDKPKKTAKQREKSIKLPSQRYPNTEIIEKHVSFETPPQCSCCQNEMEDSGMVETSEYLTMIPKKYFIVRQIRHKYRCHHCHGEIQTTPVIPRIMSGSSYSDELVIDVALSKYCDLLPIERYSAMAKRQGLNGLPPHSLIRATYSLGEFVGPIYVAIKQEVLGSILLLADETRHRMLEGSDKKNWYLWCFSSINACFFEYHDTRGGSVAAGVLAASQAIYMMSDAYCGYSKALREANEIRKQENRALITDVNCNAHARRGFNECIEETQDAEYFLDQYQKIYHLEKQLKENPEQEVKLRSEMLPYFENMQSQAKQLLEKYSSKSAFYNACNYFIKYYSGLTACLKNPLIPLDNNQSERALRSPVVGRKTWYGTHSKQGARTAAIHFTIVESCKLMKVNPRDYYNEMIILLHQNKPILTPSEFAKSIDRKKNEGKNENSS